MHPQIKDLAKIESTTWLAPAKINLFLRITGQRDDGMHALQTAFQFINLCDQLKFKISASKAITRMRDIAGVSAEEDLSLRAANLLQQAANVSQGVTISLQKHIPMGGGLGGASSNAATVLVVLNQAWKANLSIDELADLAQQLGADVPVFIRGQAAWAEGIGEQLTPINITEQYYLVAHTQDHVNTKEMYADSQLTRNCPKLTICDPEPGVLGNVFEPVVRARYPAIDAVFNWLNKFSTPFLTGSGGCVIAPVKDQQTAQMVQSQVPAGVSVFIVKSKNTSPLFDQLKS